MTEQAAAADLAAMLRLCEAGRLRCSDKTRRPTAATLQLVAESLADGEFYLGVHGPVAAGRAMRAFGVETLSGGSRTPTPAGWVQVPDRHAGHVVDDRWRSCVRAGAEVRNSPISRATAWGSSSMDST
jgi:hypothetical protein